MPFARPTKQTPRPRALARWLFAVAALVFVMLVVGGVTRLTESGLSIVRWEPVSGAVPPLTDADWSAEFAAYRATPEARTVNRSMDLAGFKRIYFWEYLHRLIGRVIGLAFALPLLWFWWRRAIPPGYGPRLLALLALGGLQGAIGWWMVASGLVDRTDVSHLRLAVHLVAALLILAGLVWTALDLRSGGQPARLGALSAALIGILGVQVMLGAFTAGLDAGYAFSTWPLMGDALFPAGGWADRLGLLNLRDNPIAVQFAHRWFAWIAAAAVVAMAVRARRAGAKGSVHALVTFVALQIALGVLTLTSGVALPLAAAHQAVAALLVVAMIVAAHRVGYMNT